MDIAIIGSGNVATVLGLKLLNGRHRIRQIFSRNAVNGAALAKLLNASFVSETSQLDSCATVWIIAIADNAIPQMIQTLHPGKALLVHTAGSVSMNILSTAATRYGVWYPLQSLRKEIAQTDPVPMLVDASDAKGIEMLTQLAVSIGSSVTQAGDEARRKYHLAAVMINNFSNHLASRTQQFCRSEGLDFQVLMPLLDQWVSRLHAHDADQLQTGPAIRRDDQTIQKHLSMLEAYPGLKKLYQIFTDSIQEFR